MKFTNITIALVFPDLCEPTVGEGRSRVAMSESRPLICKKGTPMSHRKQRGERGDSRISGMNDLGMIK